MLSRNLFLLVLVGCFLASCAKDDLAFDIIESPVLAQFEALGDTDPGMLKVKATFLDLDKSGILDQNIGIDSLPVAGLEIKVYVFESDLVGELMTDSDGSVIFEEEITNLMGASRLEWVGVYEDTPFRIYQNF
ncbi:hypothetical protein [Flavilitoribacter nigricans]|uniref:Uncharacterized protein n=1 Tax=Flavilitoribacter nigricans (strain ATCC 23147 / DSM 23189 / NBRC 102662 / NCIMB 1420 / SS-2) TaxID=1122177 RepID=A0A2D0NFL4_FLAN2|nr:hypothetical protein [Flavilitoribacter nigricans]PHN07281.1 hypothetical protein CRP01_06525 [Flavilitoribacter nigricans DSM 23189 = NBRC 102662]